MKISLSLIAGALLMTAAIASAHDSSYERQMLYKLPKLAPPEADASFNHPMHIDHIEDSKSVFAYLTKTDVDVFEFVVTEEDLITFTQEGPQPGPVIVAASALPPACKEAKQHYPVTALLGPLAQGPHGPPGLPPADPTKNYPFEIPSGYGVIVADNPVVPEGQAREIFVDYDTKTTFFLPLGLSQFCLTEAPHLCDYSNTISSPVFYPGTYYIVTWNPTGKAIDYVANLGFREGVSDDDDDDDDHGDHEHLVGENHGHGKAVNHDDLTEEELLEYVANNNWVHGRCSEPYPANQQ